MKVELVKNELKKIIEFLNDVDEHRNHLELINVIFRDMMYKDIKIEGYEINSNILEFWYYFSGPVFLIKPNTIEEQNQFDILQDKMIDVIKNCFCELIFKSSPFDKFYTDRGIALDKYIMDNIAVNGEATIILEERLANTLFKRVILYILLGTYKLSDEEGFEVLAWLSQYYFDLGKSKSYIVI